MKLQHKLITPPVLILALICLAGTLFFLENRRVLETLSIEVNQSNNTILQAHTESVAAFMGVIEAISLDPLINQHPNELNNLLLQLHRHPDLGISFYLDTDETILADGVDPGEIERLGEELDQSEILPERFVKAEHLLEAQDDRLIYAHRFYNQGDYIGRLQMVMSLENLRGISTGLINMTAETLDRSEQHLLLIAGIIGAGVLCVLLVTMIIIRSVAYRVNRIVNVMRAIGEGEGNLNQCIETAGHDEFAELATGFNSFVGKIRGVIDLVTDASRSLSTEAGQMSGISEQTRQDVTRQQEEIGEVSTAVGEMSSTMHEIAGSANSVAEAARRAHESAVNGGNVVSDSLDGIRDLAGEVEVATETIERVAEHSRSIEEVLSIIRGISEQTNLLALNAAIEAARAGESGRGFAVVADEVRTLAVRTQEETARIQVRIESLQNQALEAVAVMIKGKEKAHQNVANAAHAGAALKDITGSATTITEMADKIACAIETESERTMRIDASFRSINEIAKAAAEGSVSASKSSHELSLMAAQMETMIVQFLLKQADDNSNSMDAGGDAIDVATKDDGIDLF